nr:hypothetical protein CKG001_10180 [Bdellovibrio sp. CKG001]
MSYELDLSFKKTMKIKLAGGEHSVRFPTCDEADDFEEKLNIMLSDKTKTSKDMRALMCAYLAELGLPETVTRKLDMIDFKELIAFVNNPKKK